MSVNGWDIPTFEARPNKSSRLLFCYPAQKYKLKCPTFEDYYPGDDYVDIM
jgi:beta-mannanase